MEVPLPHPIALDPLPHWHETSTRRALYISMTNRSNWDELTEQTIGLIRSLVKDHPTESKVVLHPLEIYLGDIGLVKLLLSAASLSLRSRTNLYLSLQTYHIRTSPPKYPFGTVDTEGGC